MLTDVGPITGVSSMATRQVLADLGKTYQNETGIRVAITPMGGVDAARSVRAGEPFDIVVLASNVMERLEAEGLILAGSRADLARSGIAMAVRAGASRPNLEDEESVKRAMLGAARIGYSTGPSGDHLKRLWARWGVAEAVSQRALRAPPGVPVGAMVARGEVDVGFQQLSELLDLPGIDIVGPLPSAIQALTIFTAGVGASSSRPEQARALVAYLASPETDAAKRRYGMDPA